VLLLVLGLAELALVVFCILDILRRRAVLGGRRWVWIVVVLLFNLAGSILYLAIGRAEPPVPETRVEPAAADGRVAAAAEILYGSEPGAEASDGGVPVPSSGAGAKEEV